MYGDDHPLLPIFRCPSRTSGHLTYTSQPKNSSILGFEHFRSDFTAACCLSSLKGFDSSEDFGCSDSTFLLQIFFCVCDSVRVTGFGRSLKCSLHLPRLSSSLLSKASFWTLMDLLLYCMVILYSLPRRRRDGPPEHFVVLIVFEMQFIPGIDCTSDFFTVSTADFRASAYRERKEESASPEAMPWRRRCFLEQYLSPPGSTTGHYFTIIRHTESFPSVYPGSRWSYSCHSSSASVVHSEQSRKLSKLHDWLTSSTCANMLFCANWQWYDVLFRREYR